MTTPSSAVTSSRKVLYVDLDGSLIATDMVWESMLQHLKHNPLAPLIWIFWLSKGIIFFKLKVAQFLKTDFTKLPYHKHVIELISSYRSNGYEVVLATASVKDIALKVSSALGIFDSVLSTTSYINLKGKKKLEGIQNHAQGRDWIYIGDARIDIVIWKKAGKGICVNASSFLKSATKDLKMTYLEHPKKSKIITLLKAIRIHQTFKNLLIFVPLIAAHRWTDMSAVQNTVLAFCSFSLTAFGVYVLNDLLDLNSDRAHWSKKHRAFASGVFSIPFGLILSGSFFVFSFCISFLFLNQGFNGILFFYVVLTMLYSLRLKKILLLDIFCLSVLYTVRIFSGSEATQIEVSNWLLAFAVFAFSGLATLKRYIELVNAEKNQSEIPAGRGYLVKDKNVLLATGVAASFLSLVIMALYFSSPEIYKLYQKPDKLWFLIPICMYWYSRIWVVANRGEAHDDPILIVLKDKASYIFAILFLGVLWLAI